MLFDSAAYVVFLILVVVVYWKLRHEWQNRFLLAASYVFYAWWNWRFLFVMIASTAMDFLVAGAISTSADPRRKRALLVLSLVINVSVLGFFKVFVGMHGIILPAAISFYTFQEVAYIVDVYYGRIAATESFVDYGLFISF